MHTLMVIGGGLLLLGLCLIVARFAGVGLGRAALVFVPLWFVGAAINLYVGVSSAGYTVMEEAPIFLVVFGVPALVALLVWWKV